MESTNQVTGHAMHQTHMCILHMTTLGCCSCTLWGAVTQGRSFDKFVLAHKAPVLDFSATLQYLQPCSVVCVKALCANHKNTKRLKHLPKTKIQHVAFAHGVYGDGKTKVQLGHHL